MLWPFNPGDRGAFHARNRVLVALADAVVVVQAGLPSGALHAASCARRLGKPLWVVPAAPWMGNFAGSLKLLEDGARALTSTDPLLSSLGLSPSTNWAPRARGVDMELQGYALSPSEYRVLRSISDVPRHVDAIVAQASESVQGKPSVTEVPRALDAACGLRSSPVSSAVRLGQGLGRGLLGGLADVVVDGLADDAGGQVVEMGVELLGECEVLGPESCVVELLGGA